MTTIALGTETGAFLVDADNGSMSDPLVPGWRVTALGRSGAHHLAAVASNWFGAEAGRTT